MEIIEANPEHFPLIEDLIHKVWEPTYRHLVYQQQIVKMEKLMHGRDAYEQQQAEGHHFFLALEDGELLGFVSFYILNEGVKIPKLYIDADSRKKGVGKALLQFVERFAKDQQLKFIELNVNRHNKALYFYRRYGFYIKASVDIPWHEFWLNDYVMRLEL